MGYIKFILAERRSTEGVTSYARISRIESDMAGTGLYEINLILHALSAGGAKPVEVLRLILNSGKLDKDVLG